MSKDTEKLSFTNLNDYLKDKKTESPSWADEAIDEVPEQPAVKKSPWAVPTAPAEYVVQWPEPPAPKPQERTAAYVSPGEDSYRSGGRGRGSRPFREDSGDRRREGKDFREARPPREPTPMPTSPPWTAFVGNLSYDITEEDVWEFFKDLRVKTVRLMVQEGKPRGFGYVEFDDLESLQEALQCSGKELLNRNIKIDIADRKDDSSFSREPRGDRPKRDSSSGNFWGANRYETMKQDRDTRTDRSRGPTGGFLGRPLDSPSERPRLDLKPRGTTSGDGETGSNADKPKPNPFGDAKPITPPKFPAKDGGAFRKTNPTPEQSRPGPGRGRGYSAQEGETRNWRKESGGRGEGGFGSQSGGRGESETKESRSRPKPKPAPEPKKKTEVSNNRFAPLASSDGDE